MTVKLTGYSEKELTKMHFTELIPPDDRKEVIDRYNKRLAGVNFPSPYASRMLKKTGEIILVQVNFVNITWEDNPAILTFARDVTKLRQLEYQLQQSSKNGINWKPGWWLLRMIIIISPVLFWAMEN